MDASPLLESMVLTVFSCTSLLFSLSLVEENWRFFFVSVIHLPMPVLPTYLFIRRPVSRDFRDVLATGPPFDLFALLLLIAVIS